jgi:aryl-alcohol dehydrogenase-like predicted oxidoreductase
MRVKSLGPGAPAVSAIGFGGMHLSIEGRPPEDVGIRVIHAALDAGVTLIDTADVYCLSHQDIGHNERLIAQAVRTWNGPRDQVTIATKGGLERPDGRWTNNGRPEHLFRACDRSLKALGVERIELYQLHAPDRRVPFKESVGALAELVSRGKVHRVGLSNVSVEEIEEARRITPITSVQNRLNPFFREALEEGVVEHCDQEGLGFLAYSPVGGGRLNLRLPAHPVVKKIAERRRITAHAVVLAWVLAQGESVFPIPSARTVEHAVDSARASEVELEEQELADIDQAEFSVAR